MEINNNQIMTIVFMVCFTFLSKIVFCQTITIDKNKISFLVGLVDDYNGKTSIPEHPILGNKITSFFCNDSIASQTFYKTLKSVIGISDFEVEKDSINNCIASFNSKKYILQFNYFYEYKLIKDGKYVDDDEKEYDVYLGKLKSCKFANDQEKLFFLKGAFIKNGTINENGNYEYSFANSPSKFKVVQKFLKKTGSKILDISVLKDNIPVAQNIIFEPSRSFKKMIENGMKY